MDLTEPAFKESVRMVFNIVKGWDGQGTIRKKKKHVKFNPNVESRYYQFQVEQVEQLFV